jgi:hypothetical protein
MYYLKVWTRHTSASWRKSVRRTKATPVACCIASLWLNGRLRVELAEILPYDLDVADGAADRAADLPCRMAMGRPRTSGFPLSTGKVPGSFYFHISQWKNFLLRSVATVAGEVSQYHILLEPAHTIMVQACFWSSFVWAIASMKRAPRSRWRSMLPDTKGRERDGMYGTSMSWVLTTRVNESRDREIGCHVKCISSKTLEYMRMLLWLNFRISFECMLCIHCEWLWRAHANHMTGYIINLISMCWALSPYIYCGLHCEWDYNVLCTYF